MKKVESYSRWFRRMVLSLGAIVLVVGSTAAYGEAISPEAKPHGKTYSQWAAAWWQWAAAIPAEDNPLLDDTGAKVAQSQAGSVWYLGGSFTSSEVVRDVVIPPGKSLFFPLINLVADNVGNDDPYTPAELVDLAASVIGEINELHATLDGVNITSDLFQYRAASGAITVIQPPEGGLLEYLYGVPVSGEVYPAVTDGYWLFITPLSAGQHVLNFGGGLEGFSLDVTYNIMVKK